MKYADYLEDSKHFVDLYIKQMIQMICEQKITDLPFLEVNVKMAYQSACEANFV